MCGAQAGYMHASDCPFPLFVADPVRAAQWLKAREELRAGAGWTEAEALCSALAQTPPGEHPADLRERLRALLDGLQDAARGVYNRENLQAPGLPVVRVAETVLYSFDGDNRRKVAAVLGLDYAEMCALLVGYVLGYEGKR